MQVFQAGEYEDDIPGNSTWAEGDWDRDGDFTSSDMVAAFASGKYESAAAMRARAVALSAGTSADLAIAFPQDQGSRDIARNPEP